MKIRIVSDLHLEFIDDFDDFVIKFSKLRKVETLILAGDITNFSEIHKKFTQFIRTIRGNYVHIVYILGNHEYYNSYNSNVVNEYKNICDELNITFLENEIVNVDGVVIGGTTLWSPISENSVKFMNDCEFLSRDSILKMNDIATEFIFDKINNDTKLDILITHHLPSYEFVSEKYTSYDNSGFANDCFDDFFSTLNVDYWVFGHTHSPVDKQIDGIRFICNPWGYPFEHSESKKGNGNDMIWYDKVITVVK